jgi:hypothetical protein
MGFPAVFYQEDSLSGDTLRSYLINSGYTEGYSWKYNDSHGNDDNDEKHISVTLLAIIISFGALFLFLTLAGVVWISKSPIFSSSFGTRRSEEDGFGSHYVPPSDPIYAPLASQDPGMSMKATTTTGGEGEGYHQSILAAAENLS